ncbi:hypothetical protein C8N32_10988 [Rhodovulum imhoffii]|uniref:Flagellar protein FliL n=1 Tax=Rhodovulum imhoffii TaxID=365340 RepID=A0A2T5BRW2_9RHOB|nr:flagellar basal body-associated protein FliL [Rhodovulum imhoffii]MBK5934079.1 hypothetical protein [Rhodovulum imhoffii]PTN01964.1 hypothetical protein C8N32_10988 [Rhodovulum imhoffii]
MGKLLPAILGLIGLAVGAGAGAFLRPATDMDTPQGTPPLFPTPPHMADTPLTYMQLENKFIVPLVSEDRVRSLVVLSLGLGILEKDKDTILFQEPKLRDAFLEVLFAHANAGGFDGAFTESVPMDALRRALAEAARTTLGPVVREVLIMDILRQDA